MSRSILCVLLVIAAAAAPTTGAVVDVYVYNFDFSVNLPGQPPVDAVVTVGDTVRWVWVEGNHTTTSVAGIPEQWDGPLSSSNPTYEHTFTLSGTWWYYCQPHGVDNGNQTAGGMSGTITVLPAGAGACCLPVGTCLVTSPASCASQGGSYQGNDTTCTPDPCAIQPITLTFPASKDCVLHESTTGTVANGAGQYLYTGNQSGGPKRRSLISFDISAIPPGAVIQSVGLRLFCNQSSGAPVDIALQRLTADWGEGASDPSGNEGSGATATTNDATWLYRFFNTSFWTTPGGDFQPVVSASLSVSPANAFYTWSSAGLVADVQAWLDDPGASFGWIMRGDEASSSNTKRFDSRQSGTVGNRPLLTVTYLPAAPTGACCLPNGGCAQLTFAQCDAQAGVFQGNDSLCAMANCPLQLTPFLDALPLPAIAQPASGLPGGAAHYEITIGEFMQQLHAQLPPTRVWGYGGSYPGPTIEARRDQPVTVTWINDLRDFDTGALRATHYFPIDTCLHGPDVTGQVPVTVTHLHGGHVPLESDGYPDLAFPPGQQSPLYTYANAQPAATIWYHDHALGITRLNVMMGLAGFYLIRDDAEDALVLPRGEFEIPLAIQDRSFNPDGSLRYHQTWHDHFYGDFILVNGKVWPYLNVKQGKYRFRMLNGSNSRVYALALTDGATFWQIGSDTGLLAAPVPLTQLTLVPGERADVVIDFAGYSAGSQVLLTNSAPAPFPGTPGVGVITNVMLFVVQGEPGHVAPLPAALVAVPRMAEAEAVTQRDFELTLIADPQCVDNPHGMWAINELMWDDITEFPRLGTTEIWSWINRSTVTHPMHMHLVSFQVLDRQDFDVVTGEPVGPRFAPEPNEMGWKDTVQAPPGQITRVIARFADYAGRFAYHCHILEHEDHEMMRQFQTVHLGDYDRDGQVGLMDYAWLPGCLAGPAAGTPAECQEVFDSEYDGDVDLRDYAEFQNCFTGP